MVVSRKKGKYSFTISLVKIHCTHHIQPYISTIHNHPGEGRQGGVGGGNMVRKQQGRLSYLGVTICSLVPIRVLKSKLTTVRIIAVPFWVLSPKNMAGCLLCCLKSVPLRSKNKFETHLSNKILVPFRVFFRNFQWAPPSFLYGSLPPPQGHIHAHIMWMYCKFYAL